MPSNSLISTSKLLSNDVNYEINCSKNKLSLTKLGRRVLSSNVFAFVFYFFRFSHAFNIHVDHVYLSMHVIPIHVKVTTVGPI